MPLAGDFNKLDRWMERLSELASPGSMQRVSRTMADAALGLVADDFSGEHGPFGGAWKAKKHPDGRPIGQGRTGRLAKYRIRHVDGASFRLGSEAPYARFFHGGTKRMKARPIVPGGGRLPAKWRGAFTSIWLTHCQLVLRGKR